MRTDKEELFRSSKSFIRFGVEKVKSEANHQQDCNQRQQDAYHRNLSEALRPSHVAAL